MLPESMRYLVDRHDLADGLELRRRLAILLVVERRAFDLLARLAVRLTAGPARLHSLDGRGGEFCLAIDQFPLLLAPRVESADLAIVFQVRKRRREFHVRQSVKLPEDGERLLV